MKGVTSIAEEGMSAAAAVTSVATGGFKLFGMGKTVLIALAAGSVVGFGSGGVLVHKLWGGHVARAENKQLKNVIKEQEFSLGLERKTSANLRTISDDKDRQIAGLNSTNSTYAASNAVLANSRAPTYEKTIVQGQGIKNEVAKTDKCATTRADDSLREFGNGTDFDPAALYVREANSELSTLAGGIVSTGTSN